MPPTSEPGENKFRRRLLNLGAATLGESGAIAAMPGIRAMWRGATVAGPAFTVECAPGDNLGIHIGVASAPEGSVLAVAVGGDLQRGYWGEVLTVAAMSVGVTGLIIDGTVRDIDAIEGRRFPVFARGTALPGAGKQGPGSVGRHVVIGDAVVRPGDWVVGDADGVVVVPAERLEGCCGAAEQRADKESAIFKRLQDGATTIELLGLSPTGIEVTLGDRGDHEGVPK